MGGKSILTSHLGTTCSPSADAGASLDKAQSPPAICLHIMVENYTDPVSPRPGLPHCARTPSPVAAAQGGGRLQAVPGRENQQTAGLR